MLNIGRRREATESLRNAIIAYYDILSVLDTDIIELHQRRQAVVSEFVDPFFNYIAKLANPPRRLKKAAGRFRESVSIFNGNVARIQGKSLLDARKMVNEPADHSEDILTVNSVAAKLTATQIVLTERSAPVLADHSEFQSATTLLEEAGIPLTLDDGLEIAKGAISGLWTSVPVLSLGWSAMKVGFSVNSRNKQIAENAGMLTISINDKTEIYQIAAADARGMTKAICVQSSQAIECMRRLERLCSTDFKEFGNNDKMSVNTLASHTLELSKLLNSRVTLLRGYDGFTEWALTWFRTHENIYRE